jgi:hypothetical protein
MYTEEELLQSLKNFREHLISPLEWEKLRNKTSQPLPTVEEILAVLPNWKTILEHFELKPKRNYTEHELLEIVEHYKEHLTSARQWNVFADKLNLPKSITLIKRFGSWSTLKQLFNLPESSYAPISSTYSKNEVIQALKEHGKHYTNRQEWDSYAKEHSLPTYKTIRNYLTYDEMKSFVKSKNYSKKELIDIALKHREYFTTVKKWNEHAKEHDLPSSVTYHRHFGSWKKAKFSVFTN